MAYTDDQQSADEEPPDPEKILITHESITKAYPISAAFNTEVLRKLETFSRCTTEVSEERKQILVKADNMEDIMALFSKLTVISESHVSFSIVINVVMLLICLSRQNEYHESAHSNFSSTRSKLTLNLPLVLLERSSIGGCLITVRVSHLNMLYLLW